MQLSTEQKAYGQLHLAVLIFGFTGLLGKVIELPEMALVWYRVLLATIGFLALNYRKLEHVPWRDALKLGGIGLVLFLHWIAFFGSIKYGNVSVAMVCLSTGVLFTALLDPLIRGARLRWYEIALSVVVAYGMYLIYAFNHVLALGLLIGLVSAFLSALYGVLNKFVVHKYSIQTINTYEFGLGFVAITALAPLYLALTPPAEKLLPSMSDWLYLICLAVVCTNVAYNLAVMALRHIPTFNYVLAFNLEAIYGVILATLVVGENRHVGVGAVLGALIVLTSVFAYPYLRQYNYRRLWRPRAG